MKSYRIERFKKLLDSLPNEVHILASSLYGIWCENPFHPSLKFKNLKKDIWFVRIGRNYRAIGKKVDSDTILWFWIGTLEEYNRFIE